MRELGLGTLLADDMGLGKTVQLIAYLLDRRDDDDAAGADRLPDLGARQLAARAAPVRAGAAHPDPPRARPHRPRRRPRGLGRGAHVLRAPAARPPPALVARVAHVRARRGPGGQEPAHAGGPDRARDHGRPPGRADRHSGREPARRPVVDHAHPEPRPAGHAHRLPAPVRDGDRAPRRRPRRGCAAADDRAVPAAAAQDRPLGAAGPAPAAGLDRVLHAHGRAGGALPGHDRRDARTRPRPLRDRAAGQRARADHAAEAGLQPPGARARPPRRAHRPLGQARPAHRDAGRGRGRGRQRARVHPVRRDGEAARRSTSSASSAATCCTSTGRPRGPPGSGSWTASRSRAASRACS